VKPAILLLAAALTGCTISTVPAGPTQYDTKVIDRDASKSAQVRLNMGAGDLKISSGTQKLLRASFTYDMPQSKPEVRYSTSGDVGRLEISQPESHAHIGHTKYEWDLRLSHEIPIDLNVQLGAGQAQLDLGSLDLRRVSVEMGVGQMHMDLCGTPKHDYYVNVEGGVGEADLKLPNNVGIEARASGGIGEISVRGLTKQNGRWVNQAFQGPGVKVHVAVEGGVGQIKLTAE